MKCTLLARRMILVGSDIGKAEPIVEQNFRENLPHKILRCQERTFDLAILNVTSKLQ